MKHRLLLATCTTVLLAACAHTTHVSQSTGQSLDVAASFYPLAYLAEQIGGDHVSVTQVTPGGVEPHDFEPTPRQLADVHNADVFLMNGGGVDAWGDDVIDELQGNGVITVRMTDTVELMDAPEGEHEDEEHEDEDHEEDHDEEGHEDEHEEGGHEHAHGEHDPHIWLSPVLMQREATMVRDAFIEADPANAEAYRANADQVLGTLDTLDGEYRDGLARCEQQFIVTSHDAFRYMARDYGFESHAIAGINADQEPSPKRIAELAELAKAEGIEYIFFETLLSPTIAETLANEVGAQALVLNPIEGLTADDEAKGADYLSIMRENLQNLRLAMTCQ